VDTIDRNKSVQRGPESWIQLAKPMLSETLQVTRYQAGDSEFECSMNSTVCMSLVIRAPLRGEIREQGKPWRRKASTAGSLVFLPRNHAAQHRWTGDTEAINVMLDTNSLLGKSALNAGLLSDRPIYNMRDPVLAQLLRYIFMENIEGSPHGTAYMEHLTLAAVARLGLQTVRRMVEDRPVREASVMTRALDYIHANLDSDLSVQEIVSASGYEGNLYAFLRLFKRQCRMGPHRYILDARLDRAKSLLAERRLTVTQVAVSCGFVNLSHFSSAFKSKWGVPPSTIAHLPEAAIIPASSE
jgi:AraC family transcriptional regulator